MEESNAYQLKITESKASLDSLTSLNNAISKMSLHHKELKTSLLELQIVYEGKLKEKACLDQSLRELQLEEASLLDRVTKTERFDCNSEVMFLNFPKYKLWTEGMFLRCGLLVAVNSNQS
jgi:hypothetical protein